MLQKGISLGIINRVKYLFLVHTNSDSAKRENVCHLCIDIYIWNYYMVLHKEGEYRDGNFEIAVAKLKETSQNIKFATLCRSVA